MSRLDLVLLIGLIAIVSFQVACEFLPRCSRFTLLYYTQARSHP